MRTISKWANTRHLSTNIALDSSEAKMLYKLALQIINNEFERSNLECFFFGGLEVFGLADVGEIANNIVAFLNKPGQDAAGI